MIAVGVVLARGELDAWARALGVDNDDDAAGEVRRLFALVDDAATYLHTVFKVVDGVPHSTLAGHLAGAMARSVQAASALVDVQRAFERHERG